MSEGHSTTPNNVCPSPKFSDMTNADVILQSTDRVNFRVHKSVLVTSSPFFYDMFTLPQPQNDETVDGLPVVHASEDAEVLNSLISMLYPVSPEIPDTDDNILGLLAATQKYDMVSVQSSIRAEVSRKGLLSPKGAEAFRLYAIACSKKLVPEMEAIALLTLGYPLTFESLGEALRSFEGWALRDLVNFRQLCTESLISCYKSCFDHRNGPSRVWVGCQAPAPIYHPSLSRNEGYSPIWLQDFFSEKLAELYGSTPTYSLDPGDLRKEYREALQSHITKKDCHVCAKVHALKGEEFCKEIEDMLAQAQNVQFSFCGAV
jgi:BTB/POZ domain